MSTRSEPDSPASPNAESPAASPAATGAASGRSGAASGRSGAASGRSGAAAPRRGWFEIRWRQLRRAPTPVVRAVLSSVVVAGVLGVLFLGYDLALDAGADLPGGDLRVLAGFLFVAAVAVLGSWLTYLLVPQPGRPGVRSGWSAALGLFAALPIAYLALVLLFQVVKPLLEAVGG